MVYFIIQIISFCLFIIMIHYLWNILKENFSVKKTKDINSTIEKYKSLMENNIHQHQNNKKLTLTSLEEIPVVENENTLLEEDLTTFLEQVIATK